MGWISPRHKPTSGDSKQHHSAQLASLGHVMASLASFLRRPPHEPLQRYMDKATACAEAVPVLFEYLFAGDLDGLAKQRTLWSPFLV